MLLALLCVGWLIFFINHISQAISCQPYRRPDRWRDRTCDRRTDAVSAQPHLPRRTASTALDGPILGGRLSGLRLYPLCRHGTACGGGQSGPAAGAGHAPGRPLRAGGRAPADRDRADRLDEEVQAALLATFDIGPARTLQQDVEFGVIQIVDIGLRAISPAVNDPSTAITCLDQLGRIMIRWVSRDPPASTLFDPRTCTG